MKGLFVLFAVIAMVFANRCPQEEGVEKLFIHEDCDKFYKCTYGEPVLQYCPAGLQFNLELEQCDWPENVDCGGRSVSVAKVQQGEQVRVVVAQEHPESEPKVDNCTPEEDNDNPIDIELLGNGCPVNPSIHLLVPHEDNCNLFYSCDNGEKVLKECAGSLHFNDELQVCDWPRDAGCAVSANKHRSERPLHQLA